MPKCKVYEVDEATLDEMGITRRRGLRKTSSFSSVLRVPRLFITLTIPPIPLAPL